MIIFESSLTDVTEPPQGFGLRLSSAAFECLCPGQSARGLAHSKTQAWKEMPRNHSVQNSGSRHAWPLPLLATLATFHVVPRGAKNYFLPNEPNLKNGHAPLVCCLFLSIMPP